MCNASKLGIVEITFMWSKNRKLVDPELSDGLKQKTSIKDVEFERKIRDLVYNKLSIREYLLWDLKVDETKVFTTK